jgi:hypothetical protein
MNDINQQYINLLVQAEEAQSRYHAIDIINRATKLREEITKTQSIERTRTSLKEDNISTVH